MDQPLPPVTLPADRETLIERILAALPDNQVQGISPEDIRSRLVEVVSSVAFLDSGGAGFPVPLRQFNAVGDGVANDAVFIAAAFASGLPLTGEGLTYGVSGSLTCPLRLAMQDVTLKQLNSSAASIRTLYAADAPRITLRRVKIDRNGAPTDGTQADSAGIYFTRCDDLLLEDVEVFGNGRGKHIRVISSNRVRIIRPYVHDSYWDEPLPNITPTQEQMSGLNIEISNDVYVDNPRIYNMEALNQWRAGDVLAPVGQRGLQRRYYGANGYQSTIAGATCGSTPPTHTSGTVSDGGVTWTYLGPKDTARRAYQAEGLSMSGCSNVTVIAPQIRNVQEGIDMSGNGINRNIKVIGGQFEDCDTYGVKLVHQAHDVGIIGVHVKRAGIGSFTFTGETAEIGDASHNCYWQDCISEDVGALSLWAASSNTGFMFSGAPPGLPPVDCLMLNCVAIDRQSPATMNWGRSDDVCNPANLRVINFQSIGHIDGAETFATPSTVKGVTAWLTTGELKHTGPLTSTTTLTGANVVATAGVTVGTALKLARQALPLVNGSNDNVPVGYTANTVSGPTGAFTISGFVAINDMYVMILNRTNQDMTIANQKTSAAANQILTMTGADITLAGNSSATFYYDSGLTKWLLVGYAP